jgi:hypothetical protein
LLLYSTVQYWTFPHHFFFPIFWKSKFSCLKRITFTTGEYSGIEIGFYIYWFECTRGAIGKEDSQNAALHLVSGRKAVGSKGAGKNH